MGRGHIDRFLKRTFFLVGSLLVGVLKISSPLEGEYSGAITLPITGWGVPNQRGFP